MIKSNLKLALDIKFLENNKIKIEVLHVHNNVHRWQNSVLYVNYNREYAFEKAYYTQYNRIRFIIPFKINDRKKGCNNYKTYYTFETEYDKYDCLNNLRKDLLNFSRSSMFNNINKKYHPDMCKIIYYRNNWYLY